MRWTDISKKKKSYWWLSVGVCITSIQWDANSHELKKNDWFTVQCEMNLILSKHSLLTMTMEWISLFLGHKHCISSETLMITDPYWVMLSEFLRSIVVLIKIDKLIGLKMRCCDCDWWSLLLLFLSAYEWHIKEQTVPKSPTVSQFETVFGKSNEWKSTHI